MPIAADKLAVLKQTFAAMLKVALNSPDDLMVVPFTSEEKEPVKAFVSLMLRPVISPEVPEVYAEKRWRLVFLLQVIWSVILII